MSVQHILTAFIHNGRKVYNAKDIKHNFPSFFHGCCGSVKNVVIRQSIPFDAVSYAIKTSTGWNPSTCNVRKSTLLLDKTWIDDNIHKISAVKTYLPAPNVLELSEAKEKLAGIKTCDIKKFLAIDTERMPVIYLFIIGRIGDLRKEMKIDTNCLFEDTGLVAKFGYTTDLKRRATEHEKTFSKFKGSTNFYLRCYARVELAHLRAAETDLRNYFKGEGCLVTDNKIYKELVILNDKFVKHTVFNKYQSLGRLYNTYRITSQKNLLK